MKSTKTFVLPVALLTLLSMGVARAQDTTTTQTTGAQTTAPLSKDQLKAQKKQQKKEEKAANAQAKAAKSEANAKKASDNAIQQQEKAAPGSTNTTATPHN
ncbi:hypothetical protein [Granulicella arctica]|uniref:hypothetical protein n=1 Tax=Granulicella arctica TaxID=940613 RepID=UPI0021DF60BB|nr:hypothetical protein [Granulicella arctica]